MVAGLGLAAVFLAGSGMDYFSWPVGGLLCLASLGAAGYFWKRAQGPKVEESTGPRIDGSLRIAEKQLPAKPRLAYGLRVTVSTEMAVNYGVRIVCDNSIHEVEALAQNGRGASARQGVPAAVRESRRGFLFAVRNSAMQRELFVRVDLYGTQPLKIEVVELIKPSQAASLPDWRDFDPEEPAADGAPRAAAGESAESAAAAPPEAVPAAAVGEAPPDTSLADPVP
jgi:hypothetical protein